VKPKTPATTAITKKMRAHSSIAFSFLFAAASSLSAIHSHATKFPDSTDPEIRGEANQMCPTG
jgi:hypothetical protein